MMLKSVLIFLAGLIIGASAIVQVQRTAVDAEYSCRVTATKTGTDANKACQNEIRWLDFVLHV